MGLVCYENERDDSNIVDASRNLFIALVLSYAVGILAQRVSRSRKRFQLYWSGGICFMLCSVQAYFLFQAANTVPASFNDEKVYRYDCHDSQKGGKISKDRQIVDRNPCFCHEYATCRNKVTLRNVTSADCPVDGTFECLESDGRSIPLTLSSKYQTYKRDCDRGRGSRCTRRDPCTPCQLEKLLGFQGATYCALCSSLNTGDCHFKPGIGPYCWKRPGSREIEPCSQCCTESLPVFSPQDASSPPVCEMPLP